MYSPEIQTKIDDYVKQHPNLTIQTPNEVLSIMLQENCFTPEEIQLIQSKKSLFTLNAPLLSKPQNFCRIMGGEFNPIKKLSPKENIQRMLKILDLEPGNDGFIDPKSISVDSVIQKYGQQNCIITEELDGWKRIAIKSLTPQAEVIITPNSDHVEILSNNSIIIIDQNDFSYCKFLLNKHEYYDSKGNLTAEIKLDNNGNKLEEIEYNKTGYPYKSIDKDSNVKNLLVEDLIKDITAKNWLGLPTTRSSIKENVLKRVTADNAEEVFAEYKAQTGNDLISDIKSEWGLNARLKKQLIEHLESVAPPEYIAQKLVDDIYGLGSGDLEHTIKLINKDNIRGVISAYTSIAMGTDLDFLKIPHTDDLYFLPEDSIEKLYGKKGQGILQAIREEWGLSKAKQDEYINYIKDTLEEVFKAHPEVYSKDIEADIKKHPDDILKLDIDIMRYSKRVAAKPDETNLAPNGEIDSSFRQNQTGDCWIISGLISILAKSGGKEILKELLQKDPTNGDIIVNLKGVSKKYRIKQNVINHSNHLAVGDGDIRAIELAIDCYLKNEAYTGNNQLSTEGNIVDIDGNRGDKLYSLLLGSGEVIEDFEQIKNTNFNQANKFFTIAFIDDSSNICKASSLDGKALTIEDHHGYAVLKEDKDFIYLFNPHDYFDSKEINQEDIIKVSKQDFYSAKPTVYSS